MKEESEAYLTTQIITYIGNKRTLLDFIGQAVDLVKEQLGKDKLEIADIFAGSGIVSRYMKQHASLLISNDLEAYTYTLNSCYLANRSQVQEEKLREYLQLIQKEMDENGLREGFISKLYAPKDSNQIEQGERAFYTTYNAKIIDTMRQLIEEQVPKAYQPFFIAPLLTEASIKNNTAGVFKGFYKNSTTGVGQFGGNSRNALSRIKNEIQLKLPIFSNFECEVKLYKKDAKDLVRELEEIDLLYMDPPYNQHPYGSNYFMLNLIDQYKEPEEISKVSGIPVNWNRSDFNKAKKSLLVMEDLCKKAKAKFILISFNSEGFIRKEEMQEMLSNLGEVTVFEKKYNTFRGSRNLNNRSLHVNEYLFLLKKR